MKRRHDPDRWADRQRHRRKQVELLAYNGWLEAREAGFAEAIKVLKIQHMMAMNVGPDKVPEPSSIWNGPKLRLKIAIRMPDRQAAVWTPERGYEIVPLEMNPDVSNALPRIWSGRSISQELADITRRAFVPTVFTQIYATNPDSRLLSP